MADIYTVVAPLALVRRTNGTMEYCYRGAPVPQDAAPGEVERLEAEGYITNLALAVPAGGVASVPVDADGKPLGGDTFDLPDPGLLNVTVPAAPSAPVTVEPEAAGRPRGNASEAAWREYHAAQLEASGTGADAARDQAAGMSRDDIRALYP